LKTALEEEKKEKKKIVKQDLRILLRNTIRIRN